MVSYQIPLCAGTQTGVEMVYLTEKISMEPIEYVAKGCEGSQNEAAAAPGHLCLFTANGPGGLETMWKNAAFREMREPDAAASLTSGTQGARAVLVTKGFTEIGKGTIPAGGAYLVAGGPWAVTAP